MKIDQIIVLLLCTVGAIGVIWYEILRVKKVYDVDKFFYVIGIIFIAITYFTYFSHDHNVQWHYVVGAIIMFFGPTVEKRLLIYGEKQDKITMRIDKRIKTTNDYHRKRSK